LWSDHRAGYPRHLSNQDALLPPTFRRLRLHLASVQMRGYKIRQIPK
jgi:hypothetical protein